MPPAPTVSVLVTVFNGGAFLPIAIESVLGQSFSDFELIIVDDGSTDATVEQLQNIDDPRLKVLVNDRNEGIPRSRNRAIDAAQGKYCAFLSHDDVCMPNRLTREIDFLESNDSIALIGSTVELIDAEGRTNGKAQMPESWVAIRWMGLLECPMRQSSLMGRSSVIKKYRYDPHFRSYSDWDFIARIARDLEVRNLPDVLAQYRRHDTNTSELHRARLEQTGVEIAFREIQSELPDFPITRAEVERMRSVVLGTSLGSSVKKSLAATRRVLEQYLDLSEAFRKKHPTHIVDPVVARVSV